MAKITPSEFFKTPETREELQAWIMAHSDGERTVAMIAAGMAWNLACKVVNDE